MKIIQPCKTCFKFPVIDNCLMATKWDNSQNGSAIKGWLSTLYFRSAAGKQPRLTRARRRRCSDVRQTLVWCRGPSVPSLLNLDYNCIPPPNTLLRTDRKLLKQHSTEFKRTPQVHQRLITNATPERTGSQWSSLRTLAEKWTFAHLIMMLAPATRVYGRPEGLT